MPVVDPLSEIRGVDFLVLHGNEEAGLGSGNSFHLVSQKWIFVQVVIEVEDREVESSPFEVEAIVDLENVPNQVDSKLGGQDVTEVQIAGFNLELLLTPQNVAHYLTSILFQNTLPSLPLFRS